MAERRSQFRAIKGGGEGTGDRGRLSTAPTPVEQPAAPATETTTPEAPVQPERPLTLAQGGKSDTDAAEDEAGSGGGQGTKSGGSKSSTPATRKPAASAGGSKAAPAAAGLSGVGAMGMRAANYIRRNKGKSGLIAGGGMLAAIFAAALLILLPLKLEALMKNLLKKEFANIEHVMEKRTEKIVLRYMFSGSGAYISGNPLSDLYRTWQISKFEDKMLNEKGIKLNNVGKGDLKVTFPDGTTRDIKSAQEFKDLYNGKLKLPNGEIDPYGVHFRGAIEDVTKWKGVLRRSHLRRWSYRAYGYNKWKIYDKTKDTSLDAAKTTVEADFEAKASTAFKSGLGRGIGCAVAGEGCPDKTPTDPENIPPPSEDTRAASKALAEGIGDAAGKGPAKTFSIELLKTLPGKVAGTALGKAIPIVGWIDILVRIFEFFYNGREYELMASLRKVQYATAFASMLTANDQHKDGSNLTGWDVQAMMDKVGGAEKSCAYQRNFNNNYDTSQCVSVSPDNRVTNPVDQVALQITQRNPQNIIIHVFAIIWLNTVGKIIDGLGWLVSKAIEPEFAATREVARFYLKTVQCPGYVAEGKLSADACNKLVDTTIADTPGLIAGLIVKTIANLFAPVYTGQEKDADLYNVADAGGDVTAQDYNKHIGGTNVDNATAANLDRTVALENARLDASKGLAYQLTSTDNPDSFVMRLATAIPSSPAQAVGNTVDSMVAALRPFSANFVQTFMSPFFNRWQPAFAADTYDHIGIQQVRWPEALLDQDIDPNNLPTKDINGDGKIDEDDCAGGEPDGITPNICRADMVTIGALKSVFTGDDDGGLGGVTAPPATGGTGGTGTPGADTSAMTCAAGTDAGIGVVHEGANGPTHNIRLCRVQGVLINASVAKNIDSLINAARAAGLNFTGGGYRTFEEQQQLYAAHGCPSVCKPQTAVPGTSNHEGGLAVDWSNNGSLINSHSNPGFVWLAAHAAQYGFQNYPVEPWHWSVDGR